MCDLRSIRRYIRRVLTRSERISARDIVKSVTSDRITFGIATCNSDNNGRFILKIKECPFVQGRIAHNHLKPTDAIRIHRKSHSILTTMIERSECSTDCASSPPPCDMTSHNDVMMIRNDTIVVVFWRPKYCKTSGAWEEFASYACTRIIGKRDTKNLFCHFRGQSKRSSVTVITKSVKKITKSVMV